MDSLGADWHNVRDKSIESGCPWTSHNKGYEGAKASRYDCTHLCSITSTHKYPALETRDGKRYYDAGPKSPEMEKLNSAFSKLHGASSLANVIGLGAMLYYGVVLAEKL